MSSNPHDFENNFKTSFQEFMSKNPMRERNQDRGTGRVGTDRNKDIAGSVGESGTDSTTDHCIIPAVLILSTRANRCEVPQVFSMNVLDAGLQEDDSSDDHPALAGFSVMGAGALVCSSLVFPPVHSELKLLEPGS